MKNVAQYPYGGVQLSFPKKIPTEFSLMLDNETNGMTKKKHSLLQKYRVKPHDLLITYSYH
uniref:Uncharacterized protein n=1 Tax=Octopus bimaculoides TaxID=37653 RepID=A0A0L8IEW5_OCTBM